VNGGKTTLTSPVLNLAAVVDPRIVFWRYYYNNHPIGGELAIMQPFITEISNDGGTSWTTVSQTQRNIGAWERIEIRVTDFFLSPGNVRVRFIAQNRVGGITEALIDDFEYYPGSGTAMVLAPAPSDHARLGAILSERRMDGMIAFRVKVDRETNLTARVFDVRGRAVATIFRGTVAPGTHELRWNGKGARGDVGTGVYFLRVDAGGTTQARKVVWTR
jgi:hypothetical protein